MSKKILTEELIVKRLKKKGIIEDPDIDTIKEKLKEFYDYEFVHSFGQRANIYFYTETTADGYEVWIASETDGVPCVAEDVYYYETQWLDKLPNAIYDGLTIYVDEYNLEESDFQYKLEEIWQEYYEEAHSQVIDELLDEGYEEEKSEEQRYGN